MPARTALHDVHLSLGATMTDFAGWAMPLRYGSETAEHHAVRTAAGLFDLSHMGEIEVAGPEAARALDYALVSDISAIRVTKAKYTMICREDGGIIDDLIVYRLAEHSYLVVANAANAGVVAGELRSRARDYDAAVHDRSERWTLIAIQGPHAAGIVTDLAGASFDDVRYYAVTDTLLAGHAVLIARTGYTGEDGFEIFCSPDAAVPLWQGLTTVGGGRGLVPAGLACRDTLRLEAGMPLYGHELRADLTPRAAGLGRVVAFGKAGEFVGRAALAAPTDSAPGRRLVGLVADGRRVPRAGYAVLDPGTGAVIGEITSGALSPTLGHPVAMAYIQGAWTGPGSRVHLDIRGATLPAEVVDLPFYRRG
jgi:aminomethyltransferase